MSDTDKKKEKGVWVTQAQVKLTGSPDIALFLAQCEFWSKCDIVKKRSGWFYKTRNEWESETWLSRYKQEKARKKLKDLNVLQERHERRNDGIRLWFRINTGLLNALLNNLDKQPVLDNNSNDMNVRSENPDIGEYLNLNSNSGCTPTDTSSVKDSVDENEIPPYSGEISTIVQENKPTEDSGNQSFSLNPDDYVFCHVFIYQFVKTQIKHMSPSMKLLWQVYGFDDHDVFDQFAQFVERHQGDMIDWYHQNTPVDIAHVTSDDVIFAQIAGRRIYVSA